LGAAETLFPAGFGHQGNVKKTSRASREHQDGIPVGFSGGEFAFDLKEYHFGRMFPPVRAPPPIFLPAVMA